MISLQYSLLYLAAIMFAKAYAACEDKAGSDQFQVGKKTEFRKKCSQIRRKYSAHCNFNSNVRDKCEESCGICGNLGNDEFCKDDSGTFKIAKGTQWEKVKSCTDVPKNPSKWCDKFNFKKKCPVACGLCTINYSKCNGLESNCGMKVDDLLYATLHNANHHELPFQNHNEELEGALAAGYRGLFLDVCKCDGEIVFCHGVCGLGRRDPTTVFANINTFLNENPRDMIIFNFEMSVGSPTPAELWSDISSVGGFTEKFYEKGSGNWPTLSQMLDSQKQIIAFQHNAGSNGLVSKIHDFFQYTMGTNWDFDQVSDISDYASSCAIRRGQSGSNFYSVNNFVTGTFGPSASASERVNEESYLKDRLINCESIMGSKPNFINIDYWQKGDLVKVTMEENAARASA
eukprot:CAMPEP_0194080804 /NCGR_PEP_ID=MMETSP0149-20130528/6745_1 /TAXON_ID=122233 /ORGANISM="Chaetoceros debilis, Strain MM31A-1" /LENGTH=401 /DNA_ID=CAMNT_0038762599 /DNA_START=77 /DNA_END=1282 /DNA_ORIENTATION=-